ncbi:MAG: glutathione peroxidase [Bacteriovoracaceae bacterium]
MSKSIYQFQVKDIKGQTFDLKDLQGKTLLIVNTASQCGFTPQYKGLEELYKKYKDKGFMILGFPCNQFGKQEPGDEKEIQGFCELNYGVTFPLFAKIDVNGSNTAPLYDFLKSANPGILGTEAIKWNFTKFLVNKDGIPVKRFAPNDSPESLEKPIKELLG